MTHFVIVALLLIMWGLTLPAVIALLWAYGEQSGNRPDPPERQL